MQYRLDIQGYRALAVLLVFIFHLNKEWLPGGYVGVDIFFVISGFLITSIIDNQKSKNKFSLINFYQKRFVRIVPAYFVAMLVTLLLACSIYLYTDILNFRRPFLMAMGFVSNLFFSSGNSYFGAAYSENPLLHTWSLSIEMQFYFILPLVMLLLNRKWLKIVLPVSILLITAYSSYNIYFLGLKNEMYFSLMARIPEFLIGSVFALFLTDTNKINKIWHNIISIFSLSILIFCAFYFDESSLFPGYLCLIPCIAFANLLIFKNSIIADIFSNKVFVYIGELSYSIYLWHWIIMAIFRYYYGEYEFSIFNLTLVIILTIITSYFSYHYVENKMKGLSLKANYKILIPSFIFTILLGYSSTFLFKYKELPEIFTKPFFGTKSNNSLSVETFGSEKNTIGKKIFLFGDSHAAILKPMINEIAFKNNFSFETLTCDAYPAYEGLKEEEVKKENIKYFLQSRKQSSITKKYIDESDVIILNTSSFDRLPSMRNAIDSLCSKLNSDQKMIIFQTWPALSGEKNPVRLNYGYIKTSNDYKYDLIYNDSDRLFRENLSKKYTNVYIIDLGRNEIFKNAPYLNDTIMYYDNGHINHYTSIRLSTLFEKEILNIIK